MAQQMNAKPLSNEETASFCNQMAMILKSGISSVEGISIMIEDAQSEDEKAILKIIEDTLQSTGSFHMALEDSGVFPPYLLKLTNIGEQSGKLDEVMASLGSHYEREAQIAASIKNAVTYPLIMISMMVLIILILIMKVLPIFSQVFTQLGQKMNGFSRGLLDLGNVLNRYSVVLIVLLFLLAAGFIIGFYTQAGRRFFSQTVGKFGFSKSLTSKIASCRFASGMALTLSSGLNPDQSLELAAALTEDQVFSKKATQCQELLNNGADFSDALSKSGIFSGMYARMVTVGYKTGSLDDVMKKIAVQYEEEIDGQISRVIAMLEPTLVAVLSVIVGVILLSVMLPLIGIMSSF